MSVFARPPWQPFIVRDGVTSNLVCEQALRSADRRVGEASCPREATHWSSRMMAKSAGLSQTAVMRIWHGFGLQPYRTETFRLSTDPLFIEKVREVIGLYLPAGSKKARSRRLTAPSRFCR